MKTLGAEAVGSTPEAARRADQIRERAVGRRDQDRQPDDPVKIRVRGIKIAAALLCAIVCLPSAAPAGRAGRRRRLLQGQAVALRGRLGGGRRLRPLRAHRGAPDRPPHSGQSDHHRAEPAGGRRHGDDQPALQPGPEGRHRDRRAAQRHPDRADAAGRRRSSTPPSSTGSAAPTARPMSPSSGTRCRSQSIAELASKEVVVGATTVGTTMNDFPLLLNDLLGYKFKIVRGYQGTPQINLAIERGEIQGNGGVGWASVKALTPALDRREEDQDPRPVRLQALSGARRRADRDRARQDRRRAAGDAAPVRAHRICAALFPAARRAGRARRRRCGAPSTPP